MPPAILPKGAIPPIKPPILPPPKPQYPPPNESENDDSTDSTSSFSDDSDSLPLKPHTGGGKRHDVGTRLQALTLLEYGATVPYIVAVTGVSVSAIYRIRRTAVARGYDPSISKQILLKYIEDAPIS